MSNWPISVATRYELLGAGTGTGTLHTTGAVATKGAWTTLGTTGFRWSALVFSAFSNAAERYRIDIGYSEGGGPEVVAVQDFFVDIQPSANDPISFTLPVRIPEGAVVKFRASGVASGRLLTGIICGYATDILAAPPSQRIVSLTDWTGNNPTNLLTQAGAAWSSWTEICASTGARVNTLWSSLSGGGDTTRTATNMLVEIGVGAAGSERPLMTHLAKSATGTLFGEICGPLPCVIPLGSRIAARVQCDQAAAADSVAIACMGAAA